MEQTKVKSNKAIFNLIDLIAVLLVIGLFIFGYLAISHKAEIVGQPTLLTYTTTNNVETIYNEAAKANSIYLNSVNEPVKIVKVTKSANGQELDIILSGQGKIEQDRSLFNGARVLLGQKAELHGLFFSQGMIKSIKYEK